MPPPWRDRSGARQFPDVCILAGGLGSRLGPITESVPKALVPVAGEPFLHHPLRALEVAGADRVLLCVGHLGKQIETVIGSQFGSVIVDYSFDGPEPAGSLGAVRRAAPRLASRFLVMYGDTYLRLDYLDFYRAWLASGRLGGMTVLCNQDRWGRSNVVYGDALVRRYDKERRSEEMQWIDYGLGALTREALSTVDSEERDLSALYRALATAGELFGYEVTDRFYEIGTPAGLRETEVFLAKGNPGVGR